MNKLEKFELIYIKFICFFSLIGMGYIFLQKKIDFHCFKCTRELLTYVFLFMIIILINIIKYYFIKGGLFVKGGTYLIFRIFELMLLALITSNKLLDIWAFSAIIFLIMFTSLLKGNKFGLPFTSFAIVLQIVLKICFTALSIENSGLIIESVLRQVLHDIFYYLSIALLAVFSGLMHNDNKKREEENKMLLQQLEEKYEQLAIAQDEIKYHYSKLKDTNAKLEESNRKLTGSIGEFYTLQQISQAISSIFDIKELLKYVNDIIIGVMGVNYSTIILYEKNKDKLRVHTTNIDNQDEFNILNQNINCPILLEALNSENPIIENFVDPEEYLFTRNREINSLICVALATKSRKFGVVLIEHKYFSAFQEDNVRLLGIIAQQVAIAMENVELYQKMHEMATIDGLTGIYNRLYFQERLQEEFKNAQAEGYELVVAIFDIDYFKRFNDTFGHLFGDKVLKNIAKLVSESLRNNDVFARYGGEEFIILFPETGLQEAYQKVELLREKIEQTCIKDNLITVSVTVSFGIACYPENAKFENDLVRKADDALYEAKKAGRNCVKIARS